MEAGAVTPLSAIVSVIALGSLIVFASSIIKHMPIAVMAGILLLVGIGLIKIDDIRKICFRSGESKIIFLITLSVTLFGGLQKAIFVGIILSIVSYLRNAAKPHIEFLSKTETALYLHELNYYEGSKNSNPVNISQSNSTTEMLSSELEPHSEQPNESNINKISTLKNQPNEPTILKISGSLFFGSVHQLETEFNSLLLQEKHKDDLIIDGSGLHYLDSAGADALTREVERRKVYGANVSIRLGSNRLNKTLESSGLFSELGEENIYYIGPKTIAREPIKENND